MILTISKMVWAFAIITLLITIFFEEDLPKQIADAWWIVVLTSLMSIFFIEKWKKWKK